MSAGPAGPFRFVFERHDALPRLAWCAEIDRGAGTVRVVHGPWVETGADWFVEGAWDGPWSEGGFARAVTFAGSGARLTERGVVFSPPSHNLDRVASIRMGGTLYVSNSIAFALERSGADVDLAYPEYFFDLLDHYRSGVTGAAKTLRTASGPPLRLWDCVNLVVGPELVERVEARDYGAAPIGYDEYVASLQATVDRVIANAGDAGRARAFPPVTALSRGYDSSAVSVLAARAGCTRAVTFMRSGNREGPDVVYLEDDGFEIASHLGLDVAAYERMEVMNDRSRDLSEYYTNPYFSTEVVTPLLAPSLEGALWLTGRHGEQFWDVDPAASQPWYRDPLSTSLGGANSMEVRLRMGYLHFPVPYTRGVHAPALNRISRSADMAPWSVGGRYDRPIARRIVESAGVPRTAFGRIKMGGGDDRSDARTVPNGWEEDMLAFVRERVPSEVRRRLVDQLRPDVPYYKRNKIRGVERWLRTRPVVRHVAPSILGHRGHPRWRSHYLYAFHWGVERTRERYRVSSED